MTPSFDVPADRWSGLSARRERLWGIVGGLVGALAGIGSVLVARRVPGISLLDLAGSPYPPFFARREIVALDYWFLVLVLAGLGFLGGAIIVLRTGRYPRTDGFGTVLVGAVLSALGGVVLFARVWAMAHG